MSYDIFLSYRREDADGHSNVATARTFKLEFERHEYNVFFDYSECTDEHFSDKILPAIRTCRYFVLVLTKGCLERCKEKGDWLRREIEEALTFHRKIIPISPDDNHFDVWPAGLPESIKELSARDGLQITTIHMDRVFEANMELLISDRMDPVNNKQRALPRNRVAQGGMQQEMKHPNLKVTVDLGCVLYIDGEEYGTLVPGRLQKIPLQEGEYMLRFESVENEMDFAEMEFNMPDKDKLYRVDLLQIKQDREQREREERERKEMERQEKERKEREERERKEREARGEFEVKGVKFKMVKVEGGAFTMGATAEQGSDAWDGEKPAHQVTLSDYYIGETQVTQALWKSVMGNNPSYWKGDNLPVERVSWEDAQEFIQKLIQETGRTFRLPAEAEWEYAARGGKKSKGYKYSGSNSIDEVAWYSNSGGKTHSVKAKKANELGLYDMSGNVFEWCNDWYGKYSSDAQTNPQGPDEGSRRVLRGGGWRSIAGNCRVSYRFISSRDHDNNVGFRLVMCP
jgi:formylglycine-generating enzyme required for sulfatase activity